MPMYLDAGTNNEQYLHEPLYLGLRQTRPSTEELYSFVDEFVEAVQEVIPNAASTLRIGPGSTRSICCTAIATRIASITTTCRALRASRSPA